MIQKEIREFINKRLAGLNVARLISFMEDTNFEFVDKKLRGAYGIATPNKVYLDLEKLKIPTPKFAYFVILHEISHAKRMVKFGKASVVGLFSCTDYEKFHNYFIVEEIFADRYASLLYYLFNFECFPDYLTQRLELPYRQDAYRHQTGEIFGIVKCEEDYDKLINQFVFN